MATCEPDFLDIGRSCVLGAILVLELVGLIVAMGGFLAEEGALGRDVGCCYCGGVEAKGLLGCVWPVPEVGFEFCAAFVKGDGVTECANDRVGSGERETVGNEADGIHRVPEKGE